jgi:hypothetical protein
VGVISLGQAILNALSKRRDDPEKAAASKVVAEEINTMLPESLSGRGAVLKKRKQYKQIEDILKQGR